MFRMPMFGFSCLGFLLVCAILAVAAWFVLRTGKDGQAKIGGLGGCAIALALLLVAGVAAVGCSAVAFLGARMEAVRRGPVRDVTLLWETPEDAREELARDERHAVLLRIELRDVEDAATITRWFRENTDGGLTISVQEKDGPEGPVTVIEVGLPISREEVLEVKRELEREIPSLRIPEGVRVEVKDPND